MDWDDFRPQHKERNTVHDRVAASYSTLNKDNTKYFQIDTYVRASRENKAKVSQTLQLDEEDARRLIAVLREAFDLTDPPESLWLAVFCQDGLATFTADISKMSPTMSC